MSLSSKTFDITEHSPFIFRILTNELDNIPVNVNIFSGGDNMDYVIRPMKAAEYPLLSDFLYEAIFIPEGVEPPSKEIINTPELQVYIADFGRYPDDRCLVAEVNGRVIGAVWTRIMDDYGHIDDETPSFAISLYKEYRGHSIGTHLMKSMLVLLKDQGCKKASLAVQKANYAVKMYLHTGFEITDENDEEYIMTATLT